MSMRDVLAELAAIWHRLPEFLGPDWPAIAPLLHEQVELLAAAPTDEQRAVIGTRILALVMPFDDLQDRIDAAMTSRTTRGPDDPDPTPRWPEITGAVVAAAGTARWIIAAFSGIGAEEALRPGQPYVLTLDVASMPEFAAHTQSRGAFTFTTDEDTVQLSVTVSSPQPDVKIEPLTSTLTIPRKGPTPAAARFLVTAGVPEALTLHVLFTHGGNFVQLMTIDVAMDPATVRTSVQGRRITTAAHQGPRDLTIVIPNQNDILLTSSNTIRATLPYTSAELGDFIEQTRQALLDVVNTRHPDLGLVFQQHLDIPDDVSHEALARLARAGYRLYQRLFFGPGADAQLQKVGSALCEYLSREPLRIQVIANHLLIPWHLMYVTGHFDPDTIDRACFLGLRHLIEYIPLNASGDTVPVDTRMDTTEGIDVVLAVNDDIDRSGQRRLVADQVDYWSSEVPGQVRVDVRRTRDDVLDALRQPSRTDHLLYFYCHAATNGLDDDGGPSRTRFIFSSGSRIDLDDLNIDAPIHRPLRGAPLVVINACESTRMSPQFYDGFLPYFIARGARGIIGTEVDTPAIVAAAWARKFFDRLLAGETVGQAILAARRELLETHGNPLGLLYTLYCDGDTSLYPAVR